MIVEKLHRKLGTAGFIVSIVALVVACAGGAYAAGGGLSGKQKKEVKKIARTEAKKIVPASGPAGPAGPVGPAGPKGEKGDNGSPGSAGANGKSVVIGNATAGPSGECPAGGKTVEVEGSGVKNKVCNGLTGFTDTLPSGKTETGRWVVTAENDGSYVGELAVSAISFPIPLAAPVPNDQVIFVPIGQTDSTCTGTVAEPTAPSGYLCVYESQNENLKNPIVEENNPAQGTGRVGTLIAYELGGESGGEKGFAGGTWAVTG